MQRLLEIMRQLRAPDGCPWDREQTHESLRPYLLEEAAEAVDAIHSAQQEAMVEELGDVLLQVAFHAVIAEEAQTFSYDMIENAIVDKLIRRHPHVFADVSVTDADEVVTNWQAIKAKEKKQPVSEVPQALPALMRATELAKKQKWTVPSQDELVQQLEQLEPSAKTVGHLLKQIAVYARAQGINPELALRDALTEEAS